MMGIRAARGRAISLGALTLLASLGLASCSDIDDALFGAPDETDMSQASSVPGTLPSGQSVQPPSAQPAPPAAEPSYQPAPSEAASAEQPQIESAPPPSSAPMMASSAVTPVQIESGSDTGTAVSKTVANLRAQLVSIENHVSANGQRLASLHGEAAQNATAYHEAKARITARLQVGTTRGNPELVAEWNAAQAALDQLTVNINAMNTLATDIANDSSNAHYVLDQISATFNVSGAVDEDHRQLSVLEDETSQTIILIDRLLKDVSEDVQRQTAYAGNERANLTTLASAIKNGELYGADLGAPAPGGLNGALSYAGSPLVVIRFDRPNVDYQQILYAALSQALQSRPGAAFSVVAVSPTRGSVAAVQLAQTAAKRHAQEVLRTITEMGVPASRLSVASQTDPAATSSEVRVFLR
jgi:hypothetical protein